MDFTTAAPEALLVSLSASMSEDILTIVFSHLDHFRDLCNSSLVCRHWKEVADDHSQWHDFLEQQMRFGAKLPKRISMTPAKHVPTAPGPSSPAAQLQPHDKAAFKAWWIEHVSLRCLEPLLGSAIIRKRSAAAWDKYSTKERQQGLAYPLAVKNLLSIDSIGPLLLGVSPTNNYVEAGGKVWNAPLPLQQAGQHIMRLINENQGCCYWYVLFQAGQEDPPVYLSQSAIHEPQQAASADSSSSAADEHEAGEAGPAEDEEEEEIEDFFLQSSSFSQFFADYIRQGLEWHEENGGEYLADDLREALQGVHSWVPLPGAEVDTDPPSSDEES